MNDIDERNEMVALLERATRALRNSIHTEEKLKNKIERQGAMISVAQAYLTAGQPEMAATILDQEVAP